VGQAARVDDDVAGAVFARGVDAVDQRTFVVALEALQLRALAAIVASSSSIWTKVVRP
jgi:hypothetical protein